MKKLTLEDTTMANVNRQQTGSTARQDSKGETAPLPRKVGDLLAAANKRDDNSLAPTLKPYPLNFSDEILSDMYLSVANMRKIIGNAVNNPTLKKKYIENLRHANKMLVLIDRAKVDISKELDKIS